jgi:hypothetical protein
VRLTPKQASDHQIYAAAQKRAGGKEPTIIKRWPTSRSRELRPLTWSSFKWAQWLVEFSNYEKAKPRDRERLRNQAQLFPQTTYDRDGEEPALTDVQARALSIDVIEGLRCCARRQRWTVPQKSGDAPKIDINVVPGSLHYVSHGFETAFLVRVAELIATVGRSIRQCARADCSRLFAVLRAGRFCTRRCAQHAATATYRERMRERKFKQALRGLSAAKAARLIEAKAKREAARQEAKLKRLERKAGMEEAAPLDPAEAERWQRQGAIP